MRHSKFLPALIVLLTIAFFTTSWTQSHNWRIIAVYDFSTFPIVKGTFTTSGAMHISGASTMQVHPNADGTKAHCHVLLKAPDGTITIHQDCDLTNNFGRWYVIGGTGAYEDLRGYGTLTMPPNTEDMKGLFQR